tara:strand:+ start:418 stop:804 length:387 start_codon:yes stop_codon:yes gene_type:complete
MARKTSSRKSPKKKENIIYSRLSSADATDTKRNILEMEASLLAIMQNIESYKDLRKRELMWKIKLKRNYKNIDNNIKEILNLVPKTPNVKKIEIEHKERKKKGLKTQVGMNIESELMDIQNKLKEMNK